MLPTAFKGCVNKMGKRAVGGSMMFYLTFLLTVLAQKHVWYCQTVDGLASVTKAERPSRLGTSCGLFLHPYTWEGIGATLTGWRWPQPLFHSPMVSREKAHREELAWRNKGIFIILMIMITKATFFEDMEGGFKLLYRKLSINENHPRTQMTLCHPLPGMSEQKAAYQFSRILWKEFLFGLASFFPLLDSQSW